MANRYKILHSGMTVVSSSTQIDYTNIQNKPTTIATASYVATSSWAINAVTSSYASTASYTPTASYVGIKILNESMSNFNYQSLLNYLSPIHYKNSDLEFEVNTYEKLVTTTTNPYQGGVYSPTQNRIYFVPGAQANQTNWHYIDCNTGLVVAYAHGATAVASAYVGGVYSPVQNRIYLVPAAQANQTNWHYIDCATGTVTAYTSGVTAVASGYLGGVYSPTQNRIYLVPFGQSQEANWHSIQEYSAAEISPALMSSALFNKY